MVDKPGYSAEEVEKLLSQNGIPHSEWVRWIYGQTCLVENQEIRYYKHDVERFIAWKTVGKPTYFD